MSAVYKYYILFQNCELLFNENKQDKPIWNHDQTDGKPNNRIWEAYLEITI